jgi:protein gp37
MKQDWVTDIRDQCLELSVPFFFKQWGGRNKKKAGRVFDGKTWDELPEVSGELQKKVPPTNLKLFANVKE